MEKEQVLINEARAFELQRYKMYKINAVKVSNPDGRDELLFLARAEKSHYKALENGLKALKKHKKISSKINILKGTKSKPSEKFNSSISDNTGDINIIQSSINLEKEDVPFYENLSKQTKNKGLKNLFITIKIQEREHIKMLRKRKKTLERIAIEISQMNNPVMLFKSMTKAKAESKFQGY